MKVINKEVQYDIIGGTKEYDSITIRKKIGLPTSPTLPCPPNFEIKNGKPIYTSPIKKQEWTTGKWVHNIKSTF